MNEKWIPPGSKCDLCGRARKEGEPAFWETHATMGGSGFNFDFCPECEKNEAACDKIIGDCLIAWRKKCEEYWKEQEDGHCV